MNEPNRTLTTEGRTNQDAEMDYYKLYECEMMGDEII